MNSTKLWLLMILTSGCGAPPDACGEPYGTYTVVLVERPGGTCGAIPAQTGVVDGWASLGSGAGCHPGDSVRPDACSYDDEWFCDDGQVTRQFQYLDNGYGDFTAVVTVRGPCSSTYDATYTRQ